MDCRTLFLTATVALATAASASPARLDVPKPPHPGYHAEVVNPDFSGGLRVPGSNALIVWGTDGTVLHSADGHRWSHAYTPTARDLAAAAVHPRGQTVIAVGASGAIIRSEDAGLHWEAAQANAAGIDLKAVVHDTRHGVWIAAGTNGAVLRSGDDGRTWQTVTTQLQLTFHSLFADERTQTLLIGGDEGVVGSSTDGGASWNLTWIAMPQPSTPITGFDRYGDLLVARSALGRFLLSDDNAHGWDLMQSQTRAFFTDSAFDPEHGAIALVGHDGTVLRSADRGVSWQATHVNLDGTPKYLSSIRYEPRNRTLLVTGHGGTIARSHDGGMTWKRASSDMKDNVEGLVASASGGLIAFGNGGLLASSVDSGQHWSPLRNSLDLYLREVAVAPQSGAFVATGQLGDIVRSIDGVGWQRIAIAYPDPSTPPDLRALAVTENGLIAAGPPGAIVRSDPKGERWSLMHWAPLEAGLAFPSIIADPRGGVLVAVEAFGAMRISRNAGSHWQQIETRPEGEFWQGTLIGHSGVMIVAGKGGSAARSVDSGAHWTSVNPGTDQDLFGVFADDANATVFLMGQNGTLQRSTDSGASWSSVDSGTTRPLRRMLRDPRTGALICFGGAGVIVRSTDAGGTWNAAQSGVDAELRKAAIEPRTGNLLIAGRAGTVLRSSDGGKTWERLPAHTTRHFTSIAASSTGDIVAVGERIVRLTPLEQP